MQILWYSKAPGRIKGEPQEENHRGDYDASSQAGTVKSAISWVSGRRFLLRLAL
jgi:hypothetical protein